MSLPFLHSVRAPAIAVTVGALIAGCGGGSSSTDDTSAASTATVSASTGNVGNDVSTTSVTSVPPPPSSTATSADSSTDIQAVATSTVAASSGLMSVQSGDTGAVTSGATNVALNTSATSTQASTSAGSQGGTTTTTTSTKATKSGLGINLGSITYYSPTLPTIDLMKKSSPWVTQCNQYAVINNCKSLGKGASSWDTLEESKLNLDAAGWPLSLPAAGDMTQNYRSVATTILSGGWQQAGKYIVRYDGAGTLSYSGVGTKNAAQSTAGRDIVDVINTSTSGLIMAIVATTPGDHLRNVRVYPPGGACASDLATYAASAANCNAPQGAFVAFENFPSGSVWHPAFLSELKNVRTARFMDWQATNSSPVTDWSQRASIAAHSWNTSVGVPLEAIVSLSNAANLDPWVNVPTHATDDYVHQFAQVLHQQLSTNLSVNVEYSNEPWNYAFPATHWMYDQAQAAWPSEVAAGTNPYLLQANWYANRLVQVCGIIKSEFGADKGRVRCVANTQAAQSAVATQVLNCTVAAKTLGQACSKSVDVLAIAPYFAGYVGSTKLRSTISGWYANADGGLGRLFDEIMGTEATSAVTAPLAAAQSGVPGGALAQIHGWMTANKAVADHFGIPMWAYEGGQGMAPPGGDTDTSFLNLLIAANRDPRMGAAYTKMFTDWQAAGGQTFALYDDVATPSKFGIWGLMENQFDTSSAKWTAVAKERDTVACWWSGC